MKIQTRLTQTLLAMTASMALCSASYAVNNLYIGPTATETGLNNSDCNWQNMWGPAFVSMTWDSSTIDPLAGEDAEGDSLGSVYMQANWTAGSGGEDVYNMAAAGNWYRGTVFDATQFSSIEMDFKYDINSTITPGAAHLDIGFDGNGGYSSQPVTTIYFTNGVGLGDGNWHHIHIPYDANSVSPGTWTAIATSGGVSWYQWNNNASVTGTMNYWMANIYLIANVTPAAPPTLSINRVTPGLHFVEGSISGQYDRQNIVTANGANSTRHYLWDQASQGSPVTYSFTISQFTASNLNYHIYLYDTAGAGGASAPDYNQPNVLIFQVSPTSNNTAAVASVTWKTNTPDAGTTVTALQITNSILDGQWQLQFTSATTGNVIDPGNNTYPFTLDPSIEANLAASQPITVNFGINPGVDTTNVLGQEVIVSQISITGVDPISSDTPITDNFLSDSGLDTNSWLVNALYSPSIWFVASNDVCSVNWTLPASGFALAATPNLGSISTGTNLNLPVSALIPGERSLVPSTFLTTNSDFFYLVKRPFSKLIVLFPARLSMLPRRAGFPARQLRLAIVMRTAMNRLQSMPPTPPIILLAGCLTRLPSAR